MFAHNSDSDNDDEEKKESNSSDTDTTTNSDSPYGSDSESSSSYDEYHAARKIPKKKNRRHYKGPVKLYIQETIGNWPKYRYKKYKKNYMKKHGIQISYGNVHTKEIKRSLKREKHEREKEDAIPVTITHMMEDLAKQASFLSLDPEHPIVPIEFDKMSGSSFKSTENEPIEMKSKSTFQKVKHKIRKSFKKKDKTSANQDDDDEQMATNSDAASVGNESNKSNQSLDRL